MHFGNRIPVSLEAWVDHLVMAAATLEQGARWCERVLGVTPGPGGQHALMGTHNRVLRIGGARFPDAYLEIIAIDPQAGPAARRRWFDLDDEVLREAVRDTPRLIHFVAATTDIALGVAALKRLEIDRGEKISAERTTPAGMLQWTISVREDGQRLFYGALPTLIEWQSGHPTKAMPASGVTLQEVRARHPRPQVLRGAHEAIGLQDVTVEGGAPSLDVVLLTPLGSVEVRSSGI